MRKPYDIQRSINGEWYTYATTPAEGDARVILRDSTDTTHDQRIIHGPRVIAVRHATCA